MAIEEAQKIAELFVTFSLGAACVALAAHIIQDIRR
jgi:hypothetical protein